MTAVEWETTHADDCEVTLGRAALLTALALDPESEALQGAVVEYQRDGDQEVENCTCGEVDRRTAAAVRDFHDANRTILVHLNVTVPRTDTRSVDEIGAAILGALDVGSDDDSVRDLEVVLALADEIGG